METYYEEQELGKTIVGKFLQKIGKGVKTVALAPIRLAWLTAMKANFGGISAKLKFGYSTAAVAARYGYSARQYAIIRSQLARAQKAFTKAGGKAQNLKNAILNGRGNQGHAINGLSSLEGADIVSIIEPILAILKTIGGIVSQLKPQPVEGDDLDEQEVDEDGPTLSYVDPFRVQKSALLTALADNYLGVGRRLFIGCMEPEQAADYGITNGAWQRYRLYYVNTARQLAQQAGVDESELRQNINCAWLVSIAAPYRSYYRPYLVWLTRAARCLDQIDAIT